MFGLGLTKMQEYAKKAGATYKIGNRSAGMSKFLKTIWSNLEFPVIMKDWLRKYIN